MLSRSLAFALLVQCRRNVFPNAHEKPAVREHRGCVSVPGSVEGGSKGRCGWAGSVAMRPCAQDRPDGARGARQGHAQGQGFGGVVQESENRARTRHQGAAWAGGSLRRARMRSTTDRGVVGGGIWQAGERAWYRVGSVVVVCFKRASHFFTICSSLPWPASWPYR